MNLSDDISALSKKQGNNGKMDFNMLTPDESEEKLQNSLGKSDILLPVRTRKMGVWSEDPPKSTKGKSGSNIIEIERFQNEKIRESEDDIPEIPDIDDIREDPLNLPDVKTAPLRDACDGDLALVDESTYKELDNQFKNFQNEQINFGNLGDIDLSFLTNKLYPEEDVQPCMNVWTIEYLFNDLSRST